MSSRNLQKSEKVMGAEVRDAAAVLIRQMALNLHYLEHDPARNNFVSCPRGWCAYARAWFEANKQVRA